MSMVSLVNLICDSVWHFVDISVGFKKLHYFPVLANISFKEFDEVFCDVIWLGFFDC